MRVRSIRMKNFRSFSDSGVIKLDQVNVVVGRNNAGKSSILRGLHQIQHGMQDVFGDVRVGSHQAIIELDLVDANGPAPWGLELLGKSAQFRATYSSANRRDGSFDFRTRTSNDGELSGDTRFPNVEPNHFIVPFLSKRKAASYGEDTREATANVVMSDVSTLAAKLARLGNPAYPSHRAYANACQSILGFIVSAIPSTNGQRPGVYLPSGDAVWIDQMGEGVPNIVQLLVSLA